MEQDTAFVNGVLEIGGCNVRELAKTYGTPLLIIDEEVFRERCRMFINVMDEYTEEYQIFYAGKAFMAMGLCPILEDEGLGLDVVSGGELYQALQAKFPPEKIIFHGNNKSEKEIIMALEENIRAIVVDNEDELETVHELARERGIRAPIMFRMVPPLEAITHPHLQTGKGSKFGLRLEGGQAREDLEKATRMSSIDVLGLHCHLGSQIEEWDIYLEAARELMKLTAQVPFLWQRKTFHLNLGGGFAIPYVQGDPSFSFKDYVKELMPLLEEEARRLNIPMPIVEMEPGRSIIGPAGTTLYTMGAPKEIEGLGTIISVDGGMSDNIRPALYGAKYRAFLAEKKTKGTTKKVSISGRLCETGDMLVSDIELQDPQKGDLLVIPTTGAYTYPMASNYNGLPRPAVVLVGSGQAHLLCRAETYEDLIVRHSIPQHLQQ